MRLLLGGESLSNVLMVDTKLIFKRIRYQRVSVTIFIIFRCWFRGKYEAYAGIKMIQIIFSFKW